MQKRKLELRVLFHEKRPGVWIAQAVNYDLNAQGRSLEHVLHAFALTVAGQIMIDIENNRQPLSATRQPPSEALAVYHKGRRIEPIDLPIPDGMLPPPWEIEAELSEARIYSA